MTVGVKGQSVEMVLHKPFGERSARGVVEAGNGVQLGVVFGSDSCRGDTEALRSKGVMIKQGPEDVPWGVQTVFEDPYGNSHVIVEPAQAD